MNSNTVSTKGKTVNQKAFSLNKYNEYTNVISSIIQKLRTQNINDYLYNQIATDLVTNIRAKDTQAAMYLTIVPASFMSQFIDDVARKVRNILSTRFRKQIQELWTQSFALGRKHMVSDLLYNMIPMKRSLSGVTKFSSLTGYSLSDFVIEDTVNFADGDISDKELNARIASAKRNLTILKGNVATLKAQGILYKDFDLDTKSGDIARYTIEQKMQYLETLLEINNFIRKSEVAERSFLGNEYFNRRYRVLTDDYLANYDLYIKDQISDYLNKNIEGIRQIQNTKTRADILINQVSKELKDIVPKRVDPLIKSERILRTELSIAYNFGKLSGFTSPEDLDRKFRWNADWELESNKRDDYEVCDPCRLMDGRIYTARDLLIVGTRLDRGVLKYRGQTTTDWKNPSLPQIPFHPNCHCYWTLVDKGSEDDAVELQVDRPLLDEAPGVPGTQTEVNNNLLPNAIGAGLVIGGMFLLARSNAWRIFYETAKEVGTTATVQSPNRVVSAVIKTGSYVKSEFPEEVSINLTNIITGLIS